MKTVLFTAAARKQFKALPAQAQAQIRAKLVRYADTGAGDVKALQGVEGFRLRSGNFRAIFVMTAEGIEVRAVGDRREIYR